MRIEGLGDSFQEGDLGFGFHPVVFDADDELAGFVFGVAVVLASSDELLAVPMSLD